MAFVDRYKKAIKKHREIDCFIGTIPEYRCRYTDSFFTTITDMAYLWEEKLIPNYNEGDHDILTRVKSIVLQLLESNDPISIYQGINCIATFDVRFKNSPQTPFTMDFSDCYEKVIEVVKKHRTLLNEYHGDKLSAFVGSAYDLIRNTIHSDPLMRPLADDI